MVGLRQVKVLIVKAPNSFAFSSCKDGKRCVLTKMDIDQDGRSLVSSKITGCLIEDPIERLKKFHSAKNCKI